MDHLLHFSPCARTVGGAPGTGPLPAWLLPHCCSTAACGAGREGCAVSTLTITSEPKDWRGAVQVRTGLFCTGFLPF